MIRKFGYRATAVLVVAPLALASVALVARGALFGREAAAPDRGLKSGHNAHIEQQLECATCHQWENGADHVMPGHDLCSICHEIDMDVVGLVEAAMAGETTDSAEAVKAVPAADRESCGFCHTREDQSVDPLVKRMSVETIFAHEPHMEAAIDCMECHSTPGEIPDLPGGPLKPWCMDCHAESEAPMLESGEPNVAFAENDCAVCHREISLETRPKFRGGARIAHDVPELWMKIHGNEAQFDPQYCATCHDTVATCDGCHQREMPRNHTVAWRRKPHGLQAMINRESCAVCHEEDSCVKCHSKTEPRSHRAGFAGSRSQHCVSCHYPPQETSCTVCHDNIEHRTASRSPHSLGIFPSNCAECHPGGLPHRAPHLMNNSVRCGVCHE